MNFIFIFRDTQGNKTNEDIFIDENWKLSVFYITGDQYIFLVVKLL